jgi:glycosyltransferase involved in cell wall biosynthesis
MRVTVSPTCGQMSSDPLVSIITTFFNAAEFIGEAIESILAQTYGNWELLLVDDGSTDRSSDIARDYSARYPGTMRCLEHPRHRNHGLGASRNLGVEHAKGAYIALLDSDDVWLPHKLEQQVQILNAHPEASMVYGATEYWYSWTGRPADLERDVVAPVGVESDRVIQPPTLLTLCYPLGRVNTPCPSDFLMRREMLERVGGFEECFTVMYEDQAFLAKVFLQEAVFVAGRRWVRYRRHPSSRISVAMRAGQYRSVRLFYLNWLAKYLSDRAVDEEEIWRALKKALVPYRHPILYRFHPTYFARDAERLIRRIGRRTLPRPLQRWLRGRRVVTIASE